MMSAECSRLDQASGSSARSRTVLAVEDLSVRLPSSDGELTVVDRLGLTLERGETLCVVGESGSGKTMSALGILGLARHMGGIVTGSARLEGRDLVALSDRELESVRGNDISMIFQQPRRALDPAFTVRRQLADVARRHLSLSRRAAVDHAVDMLGRVGISSPRRRVDDYPHQFSGGMCQRVLIALALTASPKVLVADEPTTALDVTVQKTILDLLQRLAAEFELSVLFITHDLGVVAEVADRVMVMYAGQAVETSSVSKFFAAPAHPYSSALLAALPQLQRRGERMQLIAGHVRPPYEWPIGCRFAERCQFARPGCTAAPIPLSTSQSETTVRCIRAPELDLRP